jgi:hypothetical protein
MFTVDISGKDGGGRGGGPATASEQAEAMEYLLHVESAMEPMQKSNNTLRANVVVGLQMQACLPRNKLALSSLIESGCS